MVGKADNHRIITPAWLCFTSKKEFWISISGDGRDIRHSGARWTILNPVNVKSRCKQNNCDARSASQGWGGMGGEFGMMILLKLIKHTRNESKGEQ